MSRMLSSENTTAQNDKSAMGGSAGPAEKIFFGPVIQLSRGAKQSRLLDRKSHGVGRDMFDIADRDFFCG